MYGEYEPELLAKVHDIELMMLKDFIYVCEKYNIEYFVIAGTAIGTLRHNGFIPWDDDIDIAMLRSEYHKFVKAAKIEFSTTFKGKYEMMGPGFKKKFYNMQPAMNLIGTKFVNETAWAAGYKPGFFLDIFIYENVPESDEELEKMAKKCRLFEILYIIRSVHYMKLISTHALAERPKLFAFGVLGAILRRIPKSDEWLYKQYLKTVKPYYKKTKRYSAVMDPGATYMDIWDDEMHPFVEHDFEDTKVKMVHEYEEQLIRHMGEYMTIPPENKRTNHCPKIIDLGNY